MQTQNDVTLQNTTKVGLVILSVLLPIAGYILYFAKKNEQSEAARNYLVSAIVGSVLGILLML